MEDLLLDRMRNILESKAIEWHEKQMFGGVCFMVDDKMCFGIYQGGVMARTDPTDTEELVQIEGAAQMIHGGRTMKGFIMLDQTAYDSDEGLEFWIQKALDFNPKAKASKKRKRKG